MAGRGTGIPNTFVCFVARRNQRYDAEAGARSARLGYRYPPGHQRMVLTGRTRPETSGNRPPRKLAHYYEYECECGHIGWSCVSGVERLPLRTDAR
jgi:hypothetical protein